jgi:hypothetical protein
VLSRPLSQGPLVARYSCRAGGSVRSGRWWTEALSEPGLMSFWNWSGRASAEYWCSADQAAHLQIPWQEPDQRGEDCSVGPVRPGPGLGAA